MKPEVDKLTVFFCLDEMNSTFEIQELRNCMANFNKVVLLTRDNKYLDLKKTGIDVCVLDSPMYRSAIYFLRSLKFFGLFLKEFFASPSYITHPKLFINRISSFFRANHLSEQIQTCIRQSGIPTSEIVLYSFWFNHWATAMAILSRQNTGISTITRTHGTDLFEERVPVTKRIAFRSFQLKQITRVFSVSGIGSTYLKEKYPLYKNKIFTSRLGTDSGGTNPFEKDATFTIVSCARIRNIKRIHLIPEILSTIGFPIKWIHVGGENANDPTLPLLTQNLERLRASGKQVEVVFTGDLDVKNVFELYASQSINLFISVSETEGLPVSMMEAISFGIPILSTNVGGCSEIVNNNTGILIEKDFDSAEVAAKIANFRKSDMNTLLFRNGVVEFWKNNFNSVTNFQHFKKLVKAA